MGFAELQLSAYGLHSYLMVILSAVTATAVIMIAAYLFVKRRIKGILGGTLTQRQMPGEMMDRKAAA